MMSAPALGLTRKPSLTQEREKLEKDQQEAIAKAVNNVESAVKEKHIRSAIIGTWQEKGASIFWNSLGHMPLPSQVIMCWKAMLVIHKLLREGHPNALKESLKYKQMLKDMKEFWKHSTKGGYGWLIHTYLAVLIAKLDFHQKNDSIPGTLRNSDGGPLVYSGTDVNDYFELSVDMFDYLDTLVDLEKRIFSTLDRFRANSQLQAVQCRICPFPVIVQECSGLYDIVVDLMYKLHASLPADTLNGHRERFYSHFAELKKFFFDAGNMAYVKALVHVPVLPQNPPSFTLSDPKPTLLRSTSYEGPLRKLAPTEDFKRQSLMEPLTVPLTTEPLLQTTPQTPEADILGINSTAEPIPDNRDLIIYQLRAEIAELKLALERQKNDAKAVEDSLHSEIARLTEELNEYKTIAEKACEENVLLRKDLESKEDDKKDQKGPAEEKFNKLKGMYGKLREEHIQLLRTNAEVKQKLGVAEKEKEELSQVNETLQQEVDDKSTELLQVFQKAEMAEQDGKRAGDEIERLTKERDEKISSLMAELEALKQEKGDTEEARKMAEEQLEIMKKDHEEKVVALSSAVEECDMEEYDFDDYNSVASTASLLNIHAELVQEENNASTRNPPQLSHTLTANQGSVFKTFQSRGKVEKQTVINGTESLNSATSPHLREQLLRNARISKVQASISKVNNWGKYGSNSVLNMDEWKEIFLQAAQAGDLRRMQDAYSRLGGTSEIVIRITDSSANTALHKAAEAGSLPCLQWLVERLPNDCLRNISNQDHLTPLAVAIKYGNVKCVQWFLDNTTAADEMSNNAGRFALIQLTIQNGQDDCLKCLLSYISAKYLELDVADSAGVTLAHVAAREGHMTCLQTLVDHNIDVTTEDKDGRSPADYAYAAGQTGCARYLVMEESCWLLSQRVAKLHKELKDCKEENKDLKQRLEILESRARSGMPDRPEAVGGDQSDTNSTEATKSTEDRLGTKLTDSPHSDRSRASGSPDGESPKGFGQERTAYQYHINGSDDSPEHRPLSNRRLNSNGITVVNKETEVKSARQFEALKQQRRLGARGSIDSGGSGVSSPMSWSDTAGEKSAMRQVMAKQIAANTRRLVMSKHAQKVEESPLIKTKLTPVRVDGVSVDEPILKGPSLQVRQVDTYHSASSSRSHSPARTDSTSGSRPTSGTPREEMNKINKIKLNTARDEKRTASEDRAGTPARSRSLANRRKTPSFSSDSTLSSDSDIERSAQRNSGPRHRRGHPSSSRTKDQNTNTTGARQISHRQVLVGANRAKKTVSWNESPKDTNLTNVNRQIPTERPRVPPKPPARTTSRDSGVAGYVQKDRNTASRNGVNRNMGRGVVPSVIVQKPVKTVAEQSGRDMLTYSLGGYQQDDRPWYETDDFE